MSDPVTQVTGYNTIKVKCKISVRQMCIRDRQDSLCGSKARWRNMFCLSASTLCIILSIHIFALTIVPKYIKIYTFWNVWPLYSVILLLFRFYRHYSSIFSFLPVRQLLTLALLYVVPVSYTHLQRYYKNIILFFKHTCTNSVFLYLI